MVVNIFNLREQNGGQERKNGRGGAFVVGVDVLLVP